MHPRGDKNTRVQIHGMKVDETNLNQFANCSQSSLNFFSSRNVGFIFQLRSGDSSTCRRVLLQISLTVMKIH